MSFVLSVTEFQAFTSLTTFLMANLPPTVTVWRGQANRVVEPVGKDFVVMTATIRGRLETNVDTYLDSAFVGSITGGTMTVTGTLFGSVVPTTGTLVGGTGVVYGTSILGQLTGSVGGTGTYAVAPAQQVLQGTMAAGVKTALMPTKLTIQLDVHGPSSGDNAQVLATLLRDEYAVDAFATYGPDVTPLYTDDPRQVPFKNAEDQWEERWIVDAHLQVNPIVTLPQQFAAALAATLVELE